MSKKKDALDRAIKGDCPCNGWPLCGQLIRLLKAARKDRERLDYVARWIMGRKEIDAAIKAARRKP